VSSTRVIEDEAGVTHRTTDLTPRAAWVSKRGEAAKRSPPTRQRSDHVSDRDLPRQDRPGSGRPLAGDSRRRGGGVPGARPELLQADLVRLDDDVWLDVIVWSEPVDDERVADAACAGAATAEMHALITDVIGHDRGEIVQSTVSAWATAR
jgi:hypothetical protein